MAARCNSAGRIEALEFDRALVRANREAAGKMLAAGEEIAARTLMTIAREHLAEVRAWRVFATLCGRVLP